MSKHKEFIEEPIFKTVKYVVSECSLFDDLLAFYPISGYILESLFVKLTGCIEQKLKCIVWDIATDNYEIRYDYLKNPRNFSGYNDKKSAFKEITSAIISLLPYEIKRNLNEIIDNNNKNIETNKIIQKHIFEDNSNFFKVKFEDVKSKNKECFRNSIFRFCYEKDYEFYDNFELKFKSKDNQCLFVRCLNENEYENLYRHRNRIAHNLLSFQQNINNFDKIVSEKNINVNYFEFILILCYIDEIFIHLYKKYNELLLSNSY